MAGGRPGRPPGRPPGKPPGKPPGRPSGRPPGRPRGSGRARGPGRPLGRPRSDSDSTIASIDLSHIQYVPELSFLKPAKSIDDYPTFVMDNAVVYRKSTDGQLLVANVCNVNLDGPFVVRGKVEVDNEEKHCLHNPSKTTAFIEIPVCESYSIGFGPWPAVWASGKAGWYELNPAPEYRSMHEYICEGITLYYKIIDVYGRLEKNASKSKKQKALQMPIEKLLFKYAIMVGDGATLVDVKRRCQKHAPFLLAHFDQESEFMWKWTSFRRWLSATNEDLVERLEKVKKRIPPAATPAAVPAPIIADFKDESDDVVHDEPSRMPVAPYRSRNGKFRASGQSAEKDIQMKDAPPAAPIRSETHVPPPVLPPWRHSHSSAPHTPTVGDESSHALTQPQDPVKFLLGQLEGILEKHGGNPKSLKEGKLHSELYLSCTIRHYSAAREVTHFYAKSLLKKLPSKWDHSPFRNWLTAVAQQPWEPQILTKEQVPTQCARRKKVNKSGSKAPERVEVESAPRGAGKRWPPSTLTPRPAVLRPGTGVKRPAAYVSDDGDDERARKAARTSELSGDEGVNEEEVDADDHNDHDDNEVANDTSDLAEALINGGAALMTPTPLHSKDTVRIVVHSERIPSRSPSGPNGTWKCEEDGCNYIVRSAEEEEGKALVEKHFQDHTNRVERMNLALSEGTRGHMPINHLLEKIRSIGEKSKISELRQNEGVAAPQPIKRKLMF